MSDGLAYSDIFTIFEREDGTTNDRDHYKSLDGEYSIDFATCGRWGIKKYEERYIFEHIMGTMVIFKDSHQVWLKSRQNNCASFIPEVNAVQLSNLPIYLGVKGAQMKQD